MRTTPPAASAAGGTRKVTLPQEKSVPWVLIGLGVLILAAVGALLVKTGALGLS
jgi:hypothetical protein